MEYEQLAELTEPTGLHAMKISIGGGIGIVYLSSRIDSTGGLGFRVAVNFDQAQRHRSLFAQGIDEVQPERCGNQDMSRP